jgi:hypothetical protein
LLQERSSREGNIGGYMDEMDLPPMGLGEEGEEEEEEEEEEVKTMIENIACMSAETSEETSSGSRNS